VCITLPGHRALPTDARAQLIGDGLKVDARDACRYEERRVVWSAAGVWRTRPDEFVAHVIKSEFGHLSLFLEGYEYTVQPAGGAWRILAGRPSPCNPAEKAKRKPKSAAPCADAEQRDAADKARDS